MLSVPCFFAFFCEFLGFLVFQFYHTIERYMRSPCPSAVSVAKTNGRSPNSLDWLSRWQRSVVNGQPVVSATVNGKPMTDNCGKASSAFTLIELTVVILVIATLAALSITAASGVVDRAKKVQAKNDVSQ